MRFLHQDYIREMWMKNALIIFIIQKSKKKVKMRLRFKKKVTQKSEKKHPKGNYRQRSVSQLQLN